MGRNATPRRPPPALTAAALVGLAAAAAGAAIALGFLATGGDPSTPPPDPISVSTAISPRAHFFGDRVTAVVTVRVQPDLVDPRTVSIDPGFAPYTLLARPAIRRNGDSIVLQARLDCLAAACAPKAPQRQETLAPVRIRFRAGTRWQTVAEPWPPMLVASRLTGSDLQRPALRARLQPPAPPSGQPLLGWALIAAAALLFLVAAIPFARRLVGPASAVAGYPGEPNDLGLALAEVKRLAVETERQRRAAIDRLAGALARAGLQDITPRVRALAWSSRPPGADSIRHLVESIERRTRRVV